MNVRWRADGLAPCVVQDHLSGAVLMVAFMTAVALEETLRTREAHFWSRSRAELWRKGSTSGNTMSVVSVTTDCDEDTILLRVVPAGPVCHTGTDTCFSDSLPQGAAMLDLLWERIDDRMSTAAAPSYTYGLTTLGHTATTAKITEEAAEVVEAIEQHARGEVDHSRVAEEAADLIYHLMVGLAEQGVELERVMKVLSRRGNFALPDVSK